MDVCGCEDAVIVFLNPWGLSQLSIQLKVQTQVHHHPAETSRRELMLPFCALRPSKGNEGLMFANQPWRLVTMLMLLPLLLISYGVGSVRCSTVPDNSIDMLSLLDFKRAVINDPRQALSSWNNSIPHCQWEGVNCSLTHLGRVTVLNLTGLGLSGPISPSLGNLTFLNTLDLSSNSFTGELPPFNRLHRLQDLKLHQNSLQGVTPDALNNCSNLKKLDLSSNFLTGDIPLDIGLLPNLYYLALSTNNLTGMIPPSQKNSSQLQYIFLADNDLTGNILDDILQLPSLVCLVIGGNRLSGGIPEFLYKYNQSSLQTLDVGFNMLGNALPSNFGDALPNLQVLILSCNNFEGHVPASLGNISGLMRLDLSFNNFTGQVPTSLGNLAILESLNLQINNLQAKDIQSWEFIDALSKCNSLQELALGQNQLHGVIPTSIGKLSTELQYLGLDGNNLSGVVPTSIGNLSALILLDLRYNKLNGLIEGWVGNLKNLTTLALVGNNFTGPIPSSIGDLTELTYVYLAENKFEGPIPPSLGNLITLTKLNLSYNNLHGNIPKEIFHTGLTKCVLSYNNLEGSIPPEISNVIHLNELYLSSNQLTGEIPTTLGKCQELQIIEMGHNFLKGDIPMTLGGLPTLKVLNLSHNNLSGFIPNELGGLQLTQLDLSYNNLEGRVPRNGVFGNATAVSLQGNSQLCGGVLDLPPCPTISRRKETQYYLIRVLIPIFGFMSLVLLVYLLLTEKMARPKYLSSLPIGEQFLKVSYDDLAQATQNFSESNLVGRGGYGSVYRGKLTQGKIEVAVKVLDLDMHGAEKSFLSECEALRSIRHRNLVPILTACSTLDTEGSLFKALVYEFMPNGNLDTWLHQRCDGKAPKRLGLTQRVNIVLHIADALDYIHNDIGSRSIIHCDVKPSNILLDHDMTAHLGDFGIASFYHGSSLAPTGDSSTISFGVKGTIGYIGPEYAGGGHASTCGDVYSFGIVILEMLTGKRPTDPMFENGLNIVNFVEGSFPDKILQIIDAALLEECKSFAPSNTVNDGRNTVNESGIHQCLCCLLEVALSCTRQYPSERMNMRQAAARVRAIKASYVEGKSKEVSRK